MKLGIHIGGKPEFVAERARLAESLGYSSLWSGEGYGGDVVVPLAWAAAHTERIPLGSAIMQMPGRTPAMTAMTALSLSLYSGDRFVLGLGTSGPQVVEGWHGVPFRKPLAMTEEYVAILRKIFRAEGRIEHAGEFFELPYRGPDGTGVGKPLRSAFRPRDIPIYLAAIGPKNVALARRVADGLLPMLWNPFRARHVYGDIDTSAFDVAPSVPVAIGVDVAACRDEVRPTIATYVGGMGAKGHNFYNELVSRYGYEDAAATVQDLYLSGDRTGAVAAVPDALVDEVALVGDRGRVAEQLDAWKSSGVTTLILASPSRDAMTTVAELVL